MIEQSKTLLSIVGPTAIGKTSLSIILAQKLETEIISCDSRQFFREMKIGTASPTEGELNTIPHHFIGNLSIEQDYSVGDFERDVLLKIKQLFQKYTTLVMVGGSGLYERAVNEGLDEFPAINTSIKEELNKELKANGLSYLQEKLQAVDPEYYKQVDLQNPVRVIRALEIYIGTGKPYSLFRHNQVKERYFKSIKIGLTAPREVIYERINQRVDKMIKEGLLKEVENLLPFKEKNALQTVGYKELFSYFEGKISLKEAVDEIKKNSRRYAKRQLTWYRKDPSVYWFDYQNTNEVIDFVMHKVDK